MVVREKATYNVCDTDWRKIFLGICCSLHPGNRIIGLKRPGRVWSPSSKTWRIKRLTAFMHGTDSATNRYYS
jgi:hypothetical protein